MLNPNPGAPGVTVSGQSVSNRTCVLERATDLGAAPAFSLLTRNLVGPAGTISFIVTNPAGPGPFFCRVGVE